MLSFVQFVFLAVAVRASSLPTHVHQHGRSVAPNGFSHVGAAMPEQEITFRVALKSNNISGLAARLDSISDLRSATYGQWLTADEVTSHMRPSPESVAAFSVFASDNGLDVTTGGGHGEWMSFTTNISHANTLFAASFQQFQHHTAASPITRTLSYSLPFALADHVDTVYPMTTFGAPRARRIDAPVAGAFTKRQQPDSVDPAPIVPASLQLLYNIPLSAKDPADISILITGYGQDVPQINDTAAFLAHFRPDLASNTTVNIIPLNGGLDTQYLEAAKNGSDGESNLDVQTVLGLAAGIPTSFLSVGNIINDSSDLASALFDTTTFLSTTQSPPSVVTTSYGFDEAQVSPQDLQKICNGYMAAGARGISVSFASGDSGVHSRDDLASCSNDTFIAIFPASCPYVTAVGASQGFPETVAPFSAGGFSNTFHRPAYQEAAVTGFLSTIPADFPGVFSKEGRAYPDVAMQGVNYLNFDGGALAPVAGTSASAPAFASLIALLNAQLVSDGHAPLGFLNPFIYGVAGPAGAFNDITAGSNTAIEAGGPADENCNPSNTTAFTAVTGWDATTGWGTADFLRLLKAAQRGSSDEAAATTGTDATASITAEAPALATTATSASEAASYTDDASAAAPGGVWSGMKHRMVKAKGSMMGGLKHRMVKVKGGAH